MRWVGWSAGFVFAMLLSRSLVVQPDNVSLIAPSSGLALVWLASARDRAELVVDIALVTVLTVVVLLLTDGTAMQTLLSAVVPAAGAGRHLPAQTLDPAPVGRGRA